MSNPINETNFSASTAKEKRFPRHLAAVEITADLLHELFSMSEPKALSCVGGIPRDAKPFAIRHDPSRGTFIAVYEHPSFPECSEGDLIERLHPVFTAYHGEDAVRALSKNK